MLIIKTGNTSRFTTKVAGAINHSGETTVKGAQVRSTNKTNDAFLPILVERVFLPLTRSVSMSLMLLIKRTAVAKQPAAIPPRKLRMLISKV